MSVSLEQVRELAQHLEEMNQGKHAASYNRIQTYARDINFQDLSSLLLSSSWRERFAAIILLAEQFRLSLFSGTNLQLEYAYTLGLTDPHPRVRTAAAKSAREQPDLLLPLLEAFHPLEKDKTVKDILAVSLEVMRRASKDPRRTHRRYSHRDRERSKEHETHFWGSDICLSLEYVLDFHLKPGERSALERAVGFKQDEHAAEKTAKFFDMLELLYQGLGAKRASDFLDAVNITFLQAPQRFPFWFVLESNGIAQIQKVGAGAVFEAPKAMLDTPSVTQESVNTPETDAPSPSTFWQKMWRGLKIGDALGGTLTTIQKLWEWLSKIMP